MRCCIICSEETQYCNNALVKRYQKNWYDKKTNEIIVKAVNSSERRTKATINLGEEIKVKCTGKVIELWTDSRDSVNSIAEPEKIKENELSYPEFSHQFEYELKKFIYNFLDSNRE